MAPRNIPAATARAQSGKGKASARPEAKRRAANTKPAVSSLPQLRRRCAVRLRGLADLIGDLRTQCQHAFSECQQLEALHARAEQAVSVPADSPQAQVGRLEAELDRALAENRQLRGDMEHFLTFLEEVSHRLSQDARPYVLPPDHQLDPRAELSA